jgi:competence protein ComEA
MRQKWWIFVSAALIIAIIAGGAVFISRQWGGAKAIEITLPQAPASTLEIYLSGAIADEGIYTFSQDSSLEDILQRAGGVTEGIDTLRLKTRVLYIDESPFEQPQKTKININTASAEELQTLYGIGPVKAQAIIDYRNEKGFFHTVEELVNVPGIGPKTLEEIRDEITVVD